MTVEPGADIRGSEAADWFARLNQRKVSAADIQAFSVWRRDPRNAAAFERVQAAWDASETLADDPEIAALTDQARRSASAASLARTLISNALKPIGVVGAAIVILLAGWSFWSATRPTSYSTEVGEQKTVQLVDGTRLTLDTGSRVEVRLAREQRSVTLVEGQVLFAVRSDPDRPFVVTAGETRITALGTRFGVRRLGSGARVTLVEGRVKVEDISRPLQAWSLSPGEQVSTTANRPKVAPVDLRAATSWTSGRLIFQQTPIQEAVAEVNRYSERKIALDAQTIAAIPVSGAFNAGDLDGFVAALTDLYPLEAKRSDDGSIVISPIAPKTSME